MHFHQANNSIIHPSVKIFLGTLSNFPSLRLPHKLPTPSPPPPYPMISRVSQLHSAKLSRCWAPSSLFTAKLSICQHTSKTLYLSAHKPNFLFVSIQVKLYICQHTSTKYNLQGAKFQTNKNASQEKPESIHPLTLLRYQKTQVSMNSVVIC